MPGLFNILFNRCNHKWRPSIDMVQTCALCGEERVVPCSSHKWVRREVFNVTGAYGRKLGDNWVMQCSRCGEVETIRVGSTNF